MISVVIRSRDEADRLRLTLASVRRCVAAHEVVVVDDGSVDHTQAVLEEEASHQPLKIVRHRSPRGRSAASNAGARIARGEFLLFLDGDTLAGPNLVSRHVEMHAEQPEAMGRGEVFHLRCTRMLLDPETGSAQADHRETLSRRPAIELERMRVTLDQVLRDFDAIDRRAEHGVYPGSGPRLLAEAEMQALSDPRCGSIAWAAASGSNFSVRRDRFLESGGFDERLDINEHRELALRLQKRGARLQAVAGARSYHLAHRTGWRDPLTDMEWETIFLEAHPEPAVGLLVVFWASLSQSRLLDPDMRINSFDDLLRASESGQDRGYDKARLRLGAPALGASFWRPQFRRQLASSSFAMSA